MALEKEGVEGKWRKGARTGISLLMGGKSDRFRGTLLREEKKNPPFT